MFRDWNDLRVFLGAARSKAFTDAAIKLGLDPTTVARRVQRLEDELKTTLFVRSPKGLSLTAAGAALFEAARQIEATITQVQSDEAVGALAGTVRISVSEGFGAQFIAPATPAFLKTQPGLSLEIVANAGFLSASSREVDLAVTLGPPVSQRLVVEKLTPYTLRLYASPAYLAERGEPKSTAELEGHDFVGYIDDLIYAPELRYLAEIDGAGKPRTTSSSIRAQLELTAAGAGLCVLPDFMAVNNRRVTPVLGRTVRLTRTFWISIHRDLVGSKRVESVRTWLKRTAADHQDKLVPFGV